MVPTEEQNLHKLLTESQNKHTYFLLAAAASGVALAVNKTTGSSIKIEQIPLALAVAFWGLSFFLGCRQLRYVMSTLWANTEYFRVRKGAHQLAGVHPDAIEAASQGIMSAMEKNSKISAKLANWQFRLLVWGAILFLLWHVLEMVARA